jgi:hypothetical protein
LGLVNSPDHTFPKAHVKQFRRFGFFEFLWTAVLSHRFGFFDQLLHHSSHHTSLTRKRRTLACSTLHLWDAGTKDGTKQSLRDVGASPKK